MKTASGRSTIIKLARLFVGAAALSFRCIATIARSGRSDSASSHALAKRGGHVSEPADGSGDPSERQPMNGHNPSKPARLRLDGCAQTRPSAEGTIDVKPRRDQLLHADFDLLFIELAEEPR